MTNEEQKIKDILIRKFGQSCWGCEVAISDPKLLELDHIVPQCDGGSDTIENRALLCSSCNKTKGNRLTLGNLRKSNGVKSHTIDLKAALEWTRRQAASSIVDQLVIPFQFQNNVDPPPEKVPSASTNPDIPSFDGKGVHGLKQLCTLVTLRGYREAAKALQSVCEIEPKGYHHFNYNEWVSDIFLHVDGDRVEDFFVLETLDDEARKAIELSCRAVTQTAGEPGELQIILEIPEQHGSAGGDDDVDNLPF